MKNHATYSRPYLPRNQTQYHQKMETFQQHESYVPNTQNSTDLGIRKRLSFSHNWASDKASKPNTTMEIAITTSKTRQNEIKVKAGSELAGAGERRDGKS